MWVAVIGVVGVISMATSGVVVALVSSQKRAVKRVQEHVANSHVNADGSDYNLRDNIDNNQGAVLAELRGIRKDIGRLDTRSIAQGEEHRYLVRKLDAHLDWSHAWSKEREKADDDAADRLENIEDTLEVKKETS